MVLTQLSTVCLVEPEGATSQEECVHIFLADANDWDDAFSKSVGHRPDAETIPPTDRDLAFASVAESMPPARIRAGPRGVG